MFALAVVLLPPALLLGVEALVGLVHRRAAGLLHLIFIGVLSGLVAMQVVNRIGDLPQGLFAAVVGGIAVAAAFAYVRVGAIRSVLTVLGPAPLLFLGLFLFGSPVAKLTLAEDAQARPADIEGSAPVVMVIFDEFPSALASRPIRRDRPGSVSELRCAGRRRDVVSECDHGAGKYEPGRSLDPDRPLPARREQDSHRL